MASRRAAASSNVPSLGLCAELYQGLGIALFLCLDTWSTKTKKQHRFLIRRVGTCDSQ